MEPVQWRSTLHAHLNHVSKVTYVGNSVTMYRWKIGNHIHAIAQLVERKCIDFSYKKCLYFLILFNYLEPT